MPGAAARPFPKWISDVVRHVRESGGLAGVSEIGIPKPEHIPLSEERFHLGIITAAE